METFVNIHCHPYSKPFGRSQPEGQQSAERRNKTSLWFLDPFLLMHAHNYMRDNPPLLQAFNHLREDEIVGALWAQNALAFFRQHQ